MAFRPHGRAQVDPRKPKPFGICDRCGIQYNLEDLKWDLQWAGNQIINRRFLVCRTCLDKPQQQLRTLLIPPDPPPILNARPEPYSIEEN